MLIIDAPDIGIEHVVSAVIAISLMPLFIFWIFWEIQLSDVDLLNVCQMCVY